MILLWILVLIIVYIKMIDPGEKRKHPILNVKYYAHRGLHGEEGIPENSMAAFKKAKESGYGIELDVQLTKDGVMVVHHDYDLKRTCGVNKKIADLTYRELCRYRLMGTRERIPRFVEVLREVDGKVPLLVELKMETCNRKLCKKVAKALDQYKGLYCMECFQGTLIRKIGYFIVKNLLTNFITKPDFIAYHYKYKDCLPLRICRRFYKIPIYGWTFRDKKAYKENEPYFEGFIFEKFVL